MNQQIKWHIGCSGFLYKEWRDVFYPPLLPQKQWFQFYSKQFSTIELNVTFYQFPKLASLQKWYQESPDDFLFSLKVPRTITHYKKFADTKQLLADFYGILKEGLGSKLGTVLFQLPPQFQYSQEKLELIIASVDDAFHNAIEFRHKSWWQEKVYQTLASHNISFSGSSHPKLPDAMIVNTSRVYYRFHGVPDLFYSAYSADYLKEKANLILNNDSIQEAFLYFNNTASAAALENARWMIDYVATKKQE
ncbi:MAG: DUF72 domain-containing protein [Chitinophagaceae bacterium]